MNHYAQQCTFTMSNHKKQVVFPMVWTGSVLSCVHPDQTECKHTSQCMLLLFSGAQAVCDEVQIHANKKSDDTVVYKP